MHLLYKPIPFFSYRHSDILSQNNTLTYSLHTHIPTLWYSQISQITHCKKNFFKGISIFALAICFSRFAGSKKMQEPTGKRSKDLALKFDTYIRMSGNIDGIRQTVVMGGPMETHIWTVFFWKCSDIHISNNYTCSGSLSWIVINIWVCMMIIIMLL